MVPSTFKFRSLPFLIAALVAALINGFAARLSATPVSATDLFLAPSTIPDDFYPVHSFTFGSLTSVMESLSPADFGATGFTGVHILPVLSPNPSPSSSQGEYTAADLAAITVNNFDTFFFRKPGIDYTADLEPTQIRIDYRASGQYLVRIDAVGQNGAFSTILHEHVDDFFAEDPAHGLKDKGGVSRRITNPQADLVLLSDGDPNDNNFLKNAAAHMTNAGVPFTKVNSLDAVKTAIQNAFNANGMKKISVVLIGHGFGPGNGSAQGGIKIGNDYITNIPGFMTPGDFQKMIDKWVSTVEFWSCYTGGDETFLTDVANSIGIASGFATTITAAAPSVFGIFSGYFDQGAGGKKGTAVVPVPEPSSFVLFGVGALGMFGYGWYRSRQRQVTAGLRSKNKTWVRLSLASSPFGDCVAIGGIFKGSIQGQA